jgi:heme-degrading monooxygenase HmoA
MIIVCNRIPVNSEYAAQFEERFMERAHLVDGMDGFLSFHLLRPDNPDHPYTVMTYWESKAAYEAWVNSDAFKQGHARSGSLPPDTFLGHPTLEVYEVISSTD